MKRLQLPETIPTAWVIAGVLAVMLLVIPLAHGWGLTTIAATLGTATSLLLTMGLWTATFFRVGYFGHHYCLLACGVDGGNLRIGHLKVDTARPGSRFPGWFKEKGSYLRRPALIPKGGFWYTDRRGWTGNWNVRIPLWIPTVLFTSALWWSLLPFHRRRKRKKLGLCLKCGYDLRASEDRCPECGEEFSD